MSVIDLAFIASVMSEEDYARVWDRNGTGTVDATFAANMIAVAESTAYMTLNGGGAVTVPLTGTVDAAVKVAIARLAIYEAARLHPSDGQGGTKTPYRQGYEDALALLKAWREDRMRPVTANDGERSYPRVDVNPKTNTDGTAGGVYARANDGRDHIGF